jgi:exonuclease III
MIAIEIATQSLKSILILSIYVPPTAKIHVNIFHELYNLTNNCIIVGDLNVALHQMGSRRTNARGRQLQDLVNEGFINCIDDDSTTFEKNEYEEKLDWILTSQSFLSFISNVEIHPTLGTLSGHKPLTFDIPIGVEPKPASPRLSLNFKATKWTKFRNVLNEQLMIWNNSRSLNSTSDIEE